MQVLRWQGIGIKKLPLKVVYHIFNRVVGWKCIFFGIIIAGSRRVQATIRASPQVNIGKRTSIKRLLATALRVG